MRFSDCGLENQMTNESEQVREESDTKPAQGPLLARNLIVGRGRRWARCVYQRVVPIWFEILHSWTIEWIMEQELQPRQQVNFCMSVYFYNCNFASL
jgi:hypothetical protein